MTRSRLPTEKTEAFNEEINLVSLIKSLTVGNEIFVVIYRNGDERRATQAVSSYAADPELDFSWFDAAVLSRTIRDAWEETQRAKNRGERENE